MNKVFLLGLFTIILFGCNSSTNNLSDKQIVRNYFGALNQNNLEKASKYVGDSIVLSEFEFIQTNSKEEWLTQSKWDLAFSPNYKIIEINEIDGSIEASISKDCYRIKYLHDTATIYKSLFKIKNGKIQSEHIFEYVVFNFEKWSSRRDSLVKWIDVNHEYLSGFIYDQTEEGAHNYIKAIDLYSNK